MTSVHPGLSRRPLQVAVSPSGEPISVTVFEIVGRHQGPRLAVLSGVHGDEGLGPLALTTLLSEIDASELRGSVVAVPVANTPAFGLRTRTNAWDHGDLIRTWPGKPDGSVTERTAHAIFGEVVDGADALIDLHSGTPVLHEYWAIYGNAHGPSSRVTPEVERQSQGLAVAFGLDQIIRGHPWFGTHMAAANLGIPAFITEIGGGSDYRDAGERYLRVIRRGVLNVMIHLGMLTGRMVAGTQVCRVYDIAEEFISQTTGGYWLPRVHAGDSVQPGMVVGTFVDPQTGDERDRVVATKPGTILNPGADWPHVGLGQWLLATGSPVETIERPESVDVAEATPDIEASQ